MLARAPARHVTPAHLRARRARSSEGRSPLNAIACVGHAPAARSRLSLSQRLKPHTDAEPASSTSSRGRMSARRCAHARERPATSLLPGSLDSSLDSSKLSEMELAEQKAKLEALATKWRKRREQEEVRR